MKTHSTPPDHKYFICILIINIYVKPHIIFKVNISYPH